MEPGQPNLATALDELRARIQAHGGDVRAIVADGRTVELEFVGACRGCPALPMTFMSVVRPTLLASSTVSEVTCSQVNVSDEARRRLESLWAGPIRRSQAGHE